MKNSRYILCRPAGGFNDVISQIELCCRYAELTDRAVIVDTAHPDLHFLDEFSKYFVSRQNKLHLNGTHILNNLECSPEEVFPEFLGENWKSYRAHLVPGSPDYIESESKKSISLNPGVNYPHKMVIRQGPGAKSFSPMIFLRMRLHDTLCDMLQKRMAAFTQPYCAIHIRNTDYKTDYADEVRNLKDMLPGKIFISTDNVDTLNHCRQIVGEERVVSFSNLPNKGGRPIHHDIGANVDIYKLNCDAILDLFTLALAKNLTILKVNNNPRSPYSGYSLLAKSLNENKCLLAMAIGSTAEEITRHLPLL